MSEQGEGIPIFTDMIVEQNSIHENDKDIPVEYCVSIKYEDDTDSYDISESVDDYSTETMFLRQDGANQDNQVSLPNEKVIKFVSDLRQVSGFLQVLRFPPIQLTATI
jgi:hypothetical protein